MYFYDLGTSVLSSEIVKKHYKTLKSHGLFDDTSGKKVTQSAKTFNDVITNIKSPAKAFKLLSGMRDDEALPKDVSNARALYDKIQSIREPHKLKTGTISTKDFRIFELLHTYLQSGEYEKKEIGDLFGIKQNEVTGFLKTITRTIKIQEIEDVFRIRDSLPVPLHSNLLNILTADEDNDAMSSYLQLIGMQNIYKSKENLLQIVSNLKVFYEAIKNIITKEGLDSKHGISSEYNKFILLDKLLNVKQPDAKEVTLLENYWGIKTGSGKDFLEKAKTELAGNNLLKDFCGILNNVTFATRQEISKHLEAQKVIHPIAGACGLYLFLDTPDISDVLQNLYQFDKKVVDAIEKVEFFASTEEGNAAQFLANTLIYQKYFRTIVKFSAFREHNGEITSGINIFDKGKISLTNTFSSGLKRDGKLLGLGSGGDYGEIAKILKNVQLRLQLDNTKLVDSIKETLKGKNLYTPLLQIMMQ